MKKWLAVSLVAVLSMLLLAAAPAPAGPALELPGSGLTAFNDWHQHDKSRSTGVVAGNRDNPGQLKATMLEEWQIIAAELARAQNDFYLDSQYGFRVYSPEASGRIHVLTQAKAYREAVLEAAGKGDPGGVAYPDLVKPVKGFLPVAELAVSPPDKHVTTDQAVSALKNIPLPPSLFRGLTIYLLPYQVVKVSNDLGAVSGFHAGRLPGRDEVIYVAALSRDETGGFPPAEATVVHEFGHYVHNILLGPYGQYRDRWQPFLELGGKTGFVNSGDWAELTEENFAEYFRMTYGGGKAASYPYKSAYPAPEEKVKARFKALVEANSGREINGFWDYDSLRLMVRDGGGRAISLGVGPKFGLTASFLTSSPEVTFEGRLSSGAGGKLQPCIVFYPGGKLESTDEEFPPAVDGKVVYSGKMKSPGKYYMLVGYMDPAAPPPIYIGDQGMIEINYILPAQDAERKESPGARAAAGQDGTPPEAERSIRVMVDGRPLKLDVPPVIEEGRTLVPLRVIFEALDLTVGWDQSSQTVTGRKKGLEISLQIGNKSVMVNGESRHLDVPGRIVGGRTMVPARFVAESTGARVQWEEASKTVIITTM